MAQGVKGTSGKRCTTPDCSNPPATAPKEPSGFRSQCLPCIAVRARGRRDVFREERGLPPVQRADMPPQFTVPELPSEVAPIGELRERRHREWHRRKITTDAERCILVQIHVDGPIGLLVQGDWHVDDPGCDWPLMERHIALAQQTEGLFVGAVGDLQNAWVGRLARLYGNQSTSAREAWSLVEWCVRELADKPIFISAGNHDAWARTVNNIDPVGWIASQQGTHYGINGARLALHLPNGEKITINCRHDFAGRSQYNPAHGVVKAAMFGSRDDLLFAGHIHTSGYSPVKCPNTGRVSHAIRLASYKVIDDYAMERGFPDGNIAEAVMCIYDPMVEDPRHRIHVDFNVERGAWMLTELRAKWLRDQAPKAPAGSARRKRAA